MPEGQMRGGAYVCRTCKAPMSQDRAAPHPALRATFSPQAGRRTDDHKSSTSLGLLLPEQQIIIVLLATRSASVRMPSR